MKRNLFLLTALLAGSINSIFAQTPTIAVNRDLAAANNQLTIRKGTNAFTNTFRNAATGRSDVNAYLLCYLSTLIYPQYIAVVADNAHQSYVDRMHTTPDDFKREYVKYTSFLFQTPQYDFIRETSTIGYDPEAMVISTPQTVYVIFRGTDRVAAGKVNSFTYDWGEWLGTDFDARMMTSEDMMGKLLAGMWNSLGHDGFKDQLLQKVRQAGGATKKVWIAGHSLGAGQAQLFAMYMAKKGITAQGVYCYAAPHPGDQAFADELDRLFPNGRLQRFDFISDPVTAMAPYVLGYRRAGVRVYYNDINTIQFDAPERSPAEAAALIPGIMGAIGNTAADFVSEKSGRVLKLDFFNLGGSPMCYHHPLWYLQAAHSQLTATERSAVPAPLPLPEAVAQPNGSADGCDLLTITRGRFANPLDQGRTLVMGAVEEGLEVIRQGFEALSFAANSIISNVTGTALTPGDYYIKSYASEGKLFLRESSNNNGSAVSLSTTSNKVKIERFGSVGYTIQFGTKTVTRETFGVTTSETKEYVLDVTAEDMYNANSSPVQVWERNSLPGFSGNQRWLFIQVQGNKYVIKNLANGKLLDANNACLAQSSCGVKTYKPLTNDQTQIWIVEKAN